MRSGSRRSERQSDERACAFVLLSVQVPHAARRVIAAIGRTEVRRQLNTLRRNGVAGNPLVRALADIYHDHGLQEQAYEERRFHEQESDEIPRIICSEALV